MKNIAITTNADMTSGGTTSAWFDTDKNELDDDLISEFYNRFDDIKKIHHVSIISKEYKDGFPAYSKHYNSNDIRKITK